MNQELFELTNPQKSIWLTEQMYPNTSINNVAGCLKLNEKVNFKLLEEALNTFVKRNDAIRIQLCLINGKPKQYISNYEPLNLKTSIIEPIDYSKKQKSFSEKNFEIIESPLYRFELFQFPDETGGFFVVFHHLISDAWTMKLLIDSVTKYYNELLNDGFIHDEDNFSYLDYIASENDYKNSDKFLKDKLYWESLFDTQPEIASIKPILKGSNYAKRKEFTLGKEETKNINEFCKNNKISPFTLFMAILAIYIGRASNVNEIILGTPILNRGSFKSKQTPGMFISNVPFKININDTLTFTDFVKDIYSNQMKMFKHQKYPYDSLLNYVRKKFNIKQNLFTTLVSYQNARSNNNMNYDTDWIFNEYILNPLEFHIYDMDNTHEFTLYYDYQIDILKEEEIDELNNRLMHILNTVINNSNILLKNISIVTNAEKNILVNSFNKTQFDYFDDKNLCKLFVEQATNTPDNIAVVFENNSLTFKELNEKSDKLAKFLIKNKIAHKTPIALMMNRSLEMIVGIIGILKAGCCYIPIDPDYPIDRVNYILRDSNSKIVLTTKKTEITTDAKMFYIDFSNKDIYEKNHKISLDIDAISPDDLAYIIYTSGSTGKPKGVMLTHKNVNNFIEGTCQKINFSNKTIVSVTTICFDIFVLETLLPLLKGLKIVLANEEEQNISYLLNKLCLKHNVNMIQTTPSRMSALLNDSTNIEYIKNMTDIMLGGESFPIMLLQKLKNIFKGNIYNMYGPTETTVWSSIKNLTLENKITVGSPIANTQFYILDKHLNLLPPNIPGELYIGGDGVSKGYLNRDTLTNERFVANPYKKGSIIYSTGDLAKFLPNGEVVILGRTDFQVKIRGHRIELEEIENCIIKYNNIKEAVVVSKDNISLYAYFKATEEINLKELRSFLNSKLPNYMIPKYFLQLEKLPTTPNGKIDRKALPDIISQENKIFKEPQTKTQKQLIKILLDELKIDKISIDDNFFEIGGDSLIAINCVTAIHSNLKISITVKDIFSYPIIEDLAKYLDKLKSSKHTYTCKIKQKKFKNNEYPLSFAQQRIYLACSLNENSLVYNMPSAVMFDKALDVKKLKIAFNKILKNQASLRTSFHIKGEQIVQKINQIKDFEFEKYYCNKKDFKKIFLSFVRPFDLKNAPLIRIGICYFDDNDGCALLLDMHHIISDGASINILINELMNYYNSSSDAYSLPIQYKDYSCWEKEQLISEEFANKRDYFKSILHGELPKLELPYDFEAISENNISGKTYTFNIEKEYFDKINAFCNKIKITPYMFFISIYFILLNKYSGQEDIVIGSPFENRTLSELTNIIGMFVNNIIIREKVSPSLTYMDFINDIRTNCLATFNNADLPFEEILKAIDYKGNANNSSIFNTMFIFQNKGIPEIKLDNTIGKVIKYDNKTSKFNLSLEVIPTNGTYSLNFEYKTTLFKEATIKRMSSRFKKHN